MLTLVECLKMSNSTLRVTPSFAVNIVGTIGSAPDLKRNCRKAKLALNSSGQSLTTSKSLPLYCSRRHLKNEHQSHVPGASSLPAMDPLTHVLRDSSFLAPPNLCHMHRDRSGTDRYPAVYTTSRTGRLLRNNEGWAHDDYLRQGEICLRHRSLLERLPYRSEDLE